MSERDNIKQARRVVVKIGSSVLAGVEHGGKVVDAAKLLDSFCVEMAALIKGGKEIVLVSSGALAFGMRELGIKERPKSIPEIQAISAVGQGVLMGEYGRRLAKEGIKVAQVLLTHDDLSNRKRFLNARNTIFALLEKGIVPIINENDTVATEEIKFGDNDRLAALVTNLVEADHLQMLTDIDGLYDSNPAVNSEAEIIFEVEDVDHLDVDWFGKGVGSFGTGGMASKVEAARMAAHFGASTVVSSGFAEGTVSTTLAGEKVGTYFKPREDKLASKKHWIAFSARPTGRVILDDGAKAALKKGGASLLPSGITGVDGTFEAGEVIHLVSDDNMEFARGIAKYSSVEIDRIKGHRSNEIESILGYRVEDEVIHCDDLVMV